MNKLLAWGVALWRAIGVASNFEYIRGKLRFPVVMSYGKLVDVGVLAIVLAYIAWLYFGAPAPLFDLGRNEKKVLRHIVWTGDSRVTGIPGMRLSDVQASLERLALNGIIERRNRSTANTIYPDYRWEVCPRYRLAARMIW